MEFSYGRGSDQKRTGSSNDHKNNIIGAGLSADSDKNDRLQKAIARNRAKQAKRSTTGVSSETPVSSPPPMPKGISSTRRSVATAENVEFTTGSNSLLQKKSKNLVGYSTAKRKVRTRSKKSKDTKTVTYLVKVGWCFCLFLFFRLFFANGGVIEYYSSLDLLDAKKQDYEQIHLENRELLEDILKIESSPRYQRKLVRDNLGFIAKNEYLILFPKSISRGREVSSN